MPPTYEWTPASYDRTLAMTGILSWSHVSAGSHTNIQLLCRKFLGTTVKVLNENIVGVKLTGFGTAIRPRNAFTHRVAPGARSLSSSGGGTTKTRSEKN